MKKQKTKKPQHPIDSQQIASILESISDAFISVDKNWKFIFANEKALKMLGKSMDDLSEKPLLDVFPQLAGTLSLKQARSVANSQQSITYEEFSPIVNRWTQVHLYPREDGLSVFFSDITQRKLAEQQRDNYYKDLQEANALLDTLFENAPLGIGLWDTDLRFQRVNSALAEINGFPPEEHIGKKIGDILPQLDEKITANFNTVLETRQPLLNVEISGETPAAPGKLRNWTINYYPIILRNNLIGIGAICEETTEKKKLEKQKDDFLSIASHELKTPITSIKAFTQLLQKYYTATSDATAARYLKTIDTQVNKLTMLVQDLLDVAKLQKGEIDYHKDIFALDELISEVVEEMRPLTKKHTLIAEPISAITVIADRYRLSQVLTNLIANSIKYSPAGGKIVVSASIKEDEVIVRVQDSGIGIPKDKLEKIFNKFYRVFDKKRDSFPGLGLGLYISKEIVVKQGGRMWAESQEGHGSSFYFSLPISTEYQLEKKSHEKK